MHITRQSITNRMPITRKGTKYVVRSSSDVNNSVPVLIAVRDILGLARDTREVKQMIKAKLLKLNGREIIDFKEAIKLFSILEAGKSYRLIVLPTGKYSFEETKDKERLCKVVNKTLVSDEKIQLNMHDGSNVVTKDKIDVQDSVYLDFAGKIKKHVKLEKGAEVFVISGKYSGLIGKVVSISDRKVEIKIKDKEENVIVPDYEVVAQ